MKLNEVEGRDLKMAATAQKINIAVVIKTKPETVFK